ncbi:glycosyltransferase [Nitrosomonas halophila]|uniref:Glycosyl transferase 4-like domain-containing protein n=1 Tax=Nitrosomonas halophila TaxID=44576 RepID=A0A1H3ESD2_9PROT|nr:glycosyltransferase [Nitrosomonas halophila]SDX81535.1 Glycosyl transferase 4-like domain-containing protein [Nitrosomonas halophila]
MVKRVLMVAYHFPPLGGSSGIQRTLRFSQYLPDHDWEPIVLTAHPRAYLRTDESQLTDIAGRVRIYRAFALDTARHLALMNRYPRLLALPDRWVSWWLGAVPKGLSLIKRYKPDIIWSTYPIATAHLIALTLHRLTGVPWIADFRDPMVQPDYPPNPLTYRSYQWIEHKVIKNCSAAVFTTPGTLQDYQARFPHIPASRFRLIENGYDESSFASLATAVKTVRDAKQIVLLHSGIIYPSERDPTNLFEALSRLQRQGVIGSDNLNLILRASHHEKYLRSLIDRYGIGTIVSLAPPIPYREALQEMLGVDGLLLLQSANCNNQIPAKLYEYLRAQRPILALTDPAGDTAAKLESMEGGIVARLDSTDAIMDALKRFIMYLGENRAPIASLDKVLSNSRESTAFTLARLLDTIIASNRNN